MSDPAAERTLTSEAQERHRYLVVVSQLAAIAVVLMPALGAAIRCVTFATDDHFGDWVRVGLADPVPTLAGIGLVSLILPGITFLFFAWYIPVVRKSYAKANNQSTLHVPKKAFVPFIVAVLVAVAFFAPVGIGVLSTATGLLAGSLAARREVSSGLTLTKGLPLLALLILGSLASGVLGGSSAEISPIEYTFAKPGPLPNGEYIRLGATNDETFLRACFGPNPQVVGIPSTDVRLERFLSHSISAPPSFYQVIFDGRTFHLGLTYPCH